MISSFHFRADSILVYNLRVFSLQRYFLNPLSHVLDLFLYRFPIVISSPLKKNPHSDENYNQMG